MVLGVFKAEKSQKTLILEVLEVKIEVNDLRSKWDQILDVRHGLIDLCTKFQVPISFLAVTAHNIVIMQKKCQRAPPPFDSKGMGPFFRPLTSFPGNVANAEYPLV